MIKPQNRFTLVSLLLILGCGNTNVFKPVAKPDPAKEAVLALEEERASDAIDIILKALGSNYTSIYDSITESSDMNAVGASFSAELDTIRAAGVPERPDNLVSILSSAQALKFQVDILSIALQMATGKSGNSGGSNAIAALYPVLPEPTSANQLGLNIAVTLINSIPSANLSKSDKFKQALFMTSSLSLSTKSLDKNGDGVISADEATNLDATNAASILSQLESIQSTLSSGGTGAAGSNSEATAEAIGKIKEDINSSSGADQTEKLRSYLARSQ